MHRRFERLSFDVPQRQVQRPERVNLLSAGRVEPFHIHRLPQQLDLERVLADQAARALFQRILRAAFPDAGKSRVGLYRAEHITLIEQLVQVGRLIDSYSRDLSLGHCRLGAGQARESRGRRGGDRPKKVSSIHLRFSSWLAHF